MLVVLTCQNSSRIASTSSRMTAPGLLYARLAENPEGSGNRECGTRGPGRGHETWPDLRFAIGILVMIRAQVRVDEVLRNPLGQVVCRKIGEDAACDRPQVG
jgi:hypothetical protein